MRNAKKRWTEKWAERAAAQERGERELQVTNRISQEEDRLEMQLVDRLEAGIAAKVTQLAEIVARHKEEESQKRRFEARHEEMETVGRNIEDAEDAMRVQARVARDVEKEVEEEVLIHGLCGTIAPRERKQRQQEQRRRRQQRRQAQAISEAREQLNEVG